VATIIAAGSGLGVLLLGFALAMAVRQGGQGGPRHLPRRQARREQQLLRAHEAFQRRLHASALDHAQVDPYAQIVLDELTTHMKNTNEIEAR
jgi:hypothetical protein